MMSNALVPQIFDFDDSTIRIINEGGELWWVLKDVCKVLGIVDHKQVLSKLEEDEWGVLNTPHPQSTTKTLQVNCVNESGLYDVVLRSNKPNAKKFRRWITHEVIPSIRKTGKYAVQLDPIQQLIETNNRLIESVMRERALTEQNTDLKVRLNEHLEYLTVAKFNRVFRSGQLLMKEVQEIGKKLTEYCRIHHIEIRKCETQDERFAYTNSYPLSVWEHFYPDDCFDCLLMQEIQN